MIEVSAKCPCGTYLVVDITEGDADNRWSCKCPNCYDPTPEPSDKATCLGYGATPEAAYDEWWEQACDAWTVKQILDRAGLSLNLLFADLSEQAGDEAERQEEWVWTGGEGLDRLIANGELRWYGPLGVSP